MSNMLISNESSQELPGSACVNSQGAATLDQVAHLQRELHASRAREEDARTALKSLHLEVECAYQRIARQQEKLKLLVAQVRNRRASTDGAAPTVPSLRATDLASADHPYRRLLAKFPVPAPTPAQRLKIVQAVGNSPIAALWRTLPKWIKGNISAEDAAFLAALIEKIRPDQVHEIGVASGTSSALILSAMAAYGDVSSLWLRSYDLIATCYFDPSRQVGDAAREMVPNLLPHWKLKTGATAFDVLRDKPAIGRPLYFIDANHVHPWPTLDLLALLPGLHPGDCVVLHDINLPAKTGGKHSDDGAQRLFEAWHGPRLEPDIPIPNIGAIFMPDDRRLVLPSIVKSLLHPWALEPAAEINHLHRCEQSLAAFLARHDTCA